MPTVTKKDLIEQITERTGLKRNDVRTVVHETLELIVEELAAGKRIEFRDFGVFDVRARAPRIAQNPKTLERVDVPAKRSVRFKAGRLMKLKVEDTAEAPRPTVHIAPTLNNHLNNHAPRH